MTTNATEAVSLRRLSTAAWDALCQAAGATQRPSDEVLRTLVDAGLTTPDGQLETRWLSLASDYLDALIAVEMTSHYDGQVFRTQMGLGPLNTAVTRHGLAETGDGTRATTYDDQLEIAVTPGHPWTLLERLLPPLAPLHAAMRDTSLSRVRPVAVDDETRAAVLAWLGQHPGATPAQALEALGSAVLRDLVDAEAHTVYQLSWAGARPGFAVAWYAASAQHLYRATFRDDAPFEEVNPGDLAFSFQRHLMQALDILASTKGDAR